MGQVLDLALGEVNELHPTKAEREDAFYDKFVMVRRDSLRSLRTMLCTLITRLGSSKVRGDDDDVTMAPSDTDMTDSDKEPDKKEIKPAVVDENVEDDMDALHDDVLMSSKPTPEEYDQRRFYSTTDHIVHYWAEKEMPVPRDMTGEISKEALLGIRDDTASSVVAHDEKGSATTIVSSHASMRSSTANNDSKKKRNIERALKHKGLTAETAMTREEYRASKSAAALTALARSLRVGVRNVRPDRRWESAPDQLRAPLCHARLSRKN